MRWEVRRRAASETAFGTWTAVDDSAPGGANAAGVAVTGLTNGTAYAFQARAVNGLGDGAASDTVTATPSTVPAAPATFTATPGASAGSVVLAWTPGDDGGRPIGGWRYRYTPNEAFEGATSSGAMCRTMDRGRRTRAA